MTMLAAFVRDVLRVLALLLRFFLGQKRPDRCVCPPALKKPDPFLYAQYFLLSLGLPVTWDNPDIYLFDGATPVDPHDLQASKTYTVVARIWNASPDVPVVDLGVSFSYLSFGMGVQSHPIGSTTVDLNVKGLPGCPAFATVPWTTPATAGHYCIQVLLEPPDDSNWLNNLGQRNTDVRQPASPATFTFSVGNHVGPHPRRVRFSVDTYAIPPLEPCGKRPSTTGAPATAPTHIAAAPPPVPPGWTIDLEPPALVLPPGAEEEVEAVVTPPDGFHGTMPFNVTALDDTGPIGGVTLLVEVP